MVAKQRYSTQILAIVLSQRRCHNWHSFYYLDTIYMALFLEMYSSNQNKVYVAYAYYIHSYASLHSILRAYVLVKYILPD